MTSKQKKMRRLATITITIISLYTTPFLSAQNDLSSRFTHIEFDTVSQHQLLFQLENHNFFINNEFFGDYIEGYTLPGYTLQPTLAYYPSSRFRLNAGVHLQQYDGRKKYHHVVPILSAQVRLNKQLTPIMGALKGHVHHNMPEPLFNPEWQVARPIETGIQFLFRTDRLNSDLWMDWTQFIEPKDTIPEKFVVGFNGRWDFGNNQSDFGLSIPIFMTATHRGGQISDFNEPMESLFNLGSGVRAEIKTHRTIIKKWQINALAFIYKDLTNKKERPFNSGFAIYPSIIATTKRSEIMAGFCHGNNFFSPKGNPLFMSVSSIKDHYQKERNIITVKYNFNYLISKELKLNFGAESWYDTDASQLEYFYGIHLVFNPSFRISEIKQP